MHHIIDKTTPRLFIWFCKGKETCPDMLPLPSAGKFNYLERLKKECEIAKKSDTPVYLIYAGRLLNDRQKIEMEHLALQDGFENLFVQDYDDFIQHCQRDQNRAEHLKDCDALFDYSISQFTPSDMALGSIGYTVDLARLLLIAQCNTLKTSILQKCSQEKSKILNQSAEGMVYRDFDVFMEKDIIEDIQLPEKSNGFACGACESHKGIENSLIMVNKDHHPIIINVLQVIAGQKTHREPYYDFTAGVWESYSKCREHSLKNNNYGHVISSNDATWTLYNNEKIEYNTPLYGVFNQILGGRGVKFTYANNKFTVNCEYPLLGGLTSTFRRLKELEQNGYIMLDTTAQEGNRTLEFTLVPNCQLTEEVLQIAKTNNPSQLELILSGCCTATNTKNYSRTL